MVLIQGRSHRDKSARLTRLAMTPISLTSVSNLPLNFETREQPPVQRPDPRLMSGCQTSDIPPIVPRSEIGVTRADIEETKPNLKPPHALPASPPINLTHSHQLKSKISCVSCRYSCTDCWWVISVSDRCAPEY